MPELEIVRKAFPKEARVELALGSAYAHVGRAAFQRLNQAQKAETGAEGEPGTIGAAQSEIKGSMESAEKH